MSDHLAAHSSVPLVEATQPILSGLYKRLSMEGRGNRQSVDTDASIIEKYLHVLAVGREYGEVIQMGYIQAIPSTFLLAKQPGKVVHVNIFEQDIRNVIIVDANDEDCILQGIGCSHVPCYVGSPSLKKFYDIIKLKRLGLAQDALNYAEQP